MKLFDFGAFQNFMQIQSHDKIIFHMLFGAFQVTPRITVMAIALSRQETLRHEVPCMPQCDQTLPIKLP